jgi:ribosomal protein S18 acetylase RimI-like enzyme
MTSTKPRKNSKEKKSFTLRKMEIGDLAEVYELGEASFKPDLWPMLYRSWDPYEVTTLFNTDGDYCLVAENDAEDPPEDERIVGFILGTVVAKEGTAWNYGYIIWLCSHERWGGAHVASELMDELVRIMVEQDGIRIVMADTDPDNIPAVRFFEKKGLSNQKAHLYMSSNLELNPTYRDLVLAHRKESAVESVTNKRDVQRLIHEMASDMLKKSKKKDKRKRIKKKKKLKNKASLKKRTLTLAG